MKERYKLIGWSVRRFEKGADVSVIRYNGERKLLQWVSSVQDLETDDDLIERVLRFKRAVAIADHAEVYHAIHNFRENQGGLKHWAVALLVATLGAKSGVDIADKHGAEGARMIERFADEFKRLRDRAWQVDGENEGFTCPLEKMALMGEKHD